MPQTCNNNMQTEQRQLSVSLPLSLPLCPTFHSSRYSNCMCGILASRNVPHRGAPNTLLTLILRPAATRASQLPQQRQRHSAAADGGNYAKLNKQRGCKQTRIHQARTEKESETESKSELELKSRPVLSGCLVACSPGCLQQVFATQHTATKTRFEFSLNFLHAISDMLQIAGSSSA